MNEPWEDLQPGLRIRAVIAFLNWARTQRNPFKPFSEVIDGTRFTPLDLLLEPPPLVRSEEAEVLYGGRHLRTVRPVYPWPLLRLLITVRNRSRGGSSRAWRHVLNLVAVSARYADDDILAMLNDIDPVPQPELAP